MSDVHISVRDASLRFRLYRNPTPGLKETVMQTFRRKKTNGVTEFDALKNINLEVKSGDRLGIVGLNGAGKSTLLKTIVGIYPPQVGEIEVKGKITPMIELGTGFDHELSGRENIFLNGALLGRSYKMMKSLENAIIEFSELGEMIDLPIKYYSTGMHGRLAFSIGAIADPEILLMDEIFAAGDAQFVSKCMNRLHQMMDKSQILVLVSHDNNHILELCNRAIVMYKGQVVFEGSPQESIDYYMENIVIDATHPAQKTFQEEFVGAASAVAEVDGLIAPVTDLMTTVPAGAAV
jgi:ABC-type polysaccharide/polyol phosphate transport system ATPase subunit